MTSDPGFIDRLLVLEPVSVLVTLIVIALGLLAMPSKARKSVLVLCAVLLSPTLLVVALRTISGDLDGLLA